MVRTPERLRTKLVLLGGLLAACIAVCLIEITRRQRSQSGIGSTQAPGRPIAGDRMRIVSLAPSVTEILFALGVQEQIVGVTTHCDYPPAAKELARAGAFGRPNAEVLLALRPSLVVASGLDPSVPREFFEKNGIKLIDLKTGNLTEVLAAIEQVGAAVGQPQKAKSLIASMQNDFEEIERRYQTFSRNRRPRVFVELWSDPITTAGTNSFIDDIVRLAGGENVAGDLGRPYAVVNPEQVIEWNPDVIVLGYMTREPADATKVMERIGWSAIEAVKKGRVITDIPADLLLRPGPRVVQGVRMLAERIHRQ